MHRWCAEECIDANLDANWDVTTSPFKGASDSDRRMEPMICSSATPFFKCVILLVEGFDDFMLVRVDKAGRRVSRPSFDSVARSSA